MSTTNFKDLNVWQKSMDLAANVYQLIKTLPTEERYALGDQMRRSAVSIPSNIAEGKGRESDNEYLHFLAIAKGSAAELETQVLLGQKLGYFDITDIATTLDMLDAVQKMITKLRASIINKRR